MGKKYVLFLDESETFNPSNNSRIFSIAGVIINKADIPNIDTAFKALKHSIWPSDPLYDTYILHEKDISAARKSSVASLSQHHIPLYNGIFHAQSNYDNLYNQLSIFFRTNPLITIGVCLDKPSILNRYGCDPSKTQYKMAVQLLLENYCQFLIKENATGTICYEAIGDAADNVIRQRFFELLALGTLYYDSAILQHHIKKISFIPKAENISGLQLADFIPNTLARSVAGLSPKNTSLKRNIFNKLYDGHCNKKNRFGIKILD